MSNPVFYKASSLKTGGRMFFGDNDIPIIGEIIEPITKSKHLLRIMVGILASHATGFDYSPHFISGIQNNTIGGINHVTLEINAGCEKYLKFNEVGRLKPLEYLEKFLPFYVQYYHDVNHDKKTHINRFYGAAILIPRSV